MICSVGLSCDDGRDGRQTVIGAAIYQAESSSSRQRGRIQPAARYAYWTLLSRSHAEYRCENGYDSVFGFEPEEDDMDAPVPLRSDFTADALPGVAKGARDRDQTQHVLALSVIYAGSSSSETVSIGGLGLQAVRDWVVAFNARGPDELIDGKAPGARPRLNAAQRAALRASVEDGRRRPLAGWCAGAWWIWLGFCSRTIACRSPSRR